ncbi:hypothetical protein HYH02_009599 [Chlamydomonas schloesseri]|uniref:Serine-threonine/tyrosine-protein kinase catalytic domain-containing protein n=1 Tax=Chlamydomonas schloesseri TaxID=2026947 RepID=A0A835TNB4_9CHLO|nr:hypothetical protein HYH02_009599 [Chlamydomonas schloesseri]|eukprot:KAG2442110.1 hypothetical protein HYH02_009599 [Chlamydomonas schloesseri]
MVHQKAAHRRCACVALSGVRVTCGVLFAVVAGLVFSGHARVLGLSTGSRSLVDAIIQSAELGTAASASAQAPRPRVSSSGREAAALSPRASAAPAVVRLHDTSYDVSALPAHAIELRPTATSRLELRRVQLHGLQLDAADHGGEAAITTATATAHSAGSPAATGDAGPQEKQMSGELAGASSSKSLLLHRRFATALAAHLFSPASTGGSVLLEDVAFVGLHGGACRWLLSGGTSSPGSGSSGSGSGSGSSEVLVEHLVLQMPPGGCCNDETIAAATAGSSDGGVQAVRAAGELRIELRRVRATCVDGAAGGGPDGGEAVAASAARRHVGELGEVADDGATAFGAWAPGRRRLLAVAAAGSSEGAAPRGLAEPATRQQGSSAAAGAARAWAQSVLAALGLLAAVCGVWLKKLLSCACMGPGGNEDAAAAVTESSAHKQPGHNSRSAHGAGGRSVHSVGRNSQGHNLSALSRLSAQLRAKGEAGSREGSRHGGLPRVTGEGSVRGGAANAAAAAAAAPAPRPPPPPPALLSQLSEVQACGLKGRLASMLQGVWAGQQRSLIKIMLHGEDCSFMLEQVGEVWARLQHPNVVGCYAAETFATAALATAPPELAALLPEPPPPDPELPADDPAAITLQTWFVLERCDAGSLAVLLQQRYSQIQLQQQQQQQQQAAGAATAATAAATAAGPQAGARRAPPAKERSLGTKSFAKKLGRLSRGSRCKSNVTMPAEAHATAAAAAAAAAAGAAAASGATPGASGAATPVRSGAVSGADESSGWNDLTSGRIAGVDGAEGNASAAPTSDSAETPPAPHERNAADAVAAAAAAGARDGAAVAGGVAEIAAAAGLAPNVAAALAAANMSGSGSGGSNGDSTLLPGLLPVAEALAIAADVAAGLSYLHSLDLCHGDLRAENVLLQTLVLPSAARGGGGGGGGNGEAAGAAAAHGGGEHVPVGGAAAARRSSCCDGEREHNELMYGRVSERSDETTTDGFNSTHMLLATAAAAAAAGGGPRGVAEPGSSLPPIHSGAHACGSGFGVHGMGGMGAPADSSSNTVWSSSMRQSTGLMTSSSAVTAFTMAQTPGAGSAASAGAANGLAAHCNGPNGTGSGNAMASGSSYGANGAFRASLTSPPPPPPAPSAAAAAAAAGGRSQLGGAALVAAVAAAARMPPLSSLAEQSDGDSGSVTAGSAASAAAAAAAVAAAANASAVPVNSEGAVASPFNVTASAVAMINGVSAAGAAGGAPIMTSARGVGGTITGGAQPAAVPSGGGTPAAAAAALAAHSRKLSGSLSAHNTSGGDMSAASKALAGLTSWPESPPDESAAGAGAGAGGSFLRGVGGGGSAGAIAGISPVAPSATGSYRRGGSGLARAALAGGLRSSLTEPPPAAAQVAKSGCGRVGSQGAAGSSFGDLSGRGDGGTSCPAQALAAAPLAAARLPGGPDAAALPPLTRDPHGVALDFPTPSPVAAGAAAPPTAAAAAPPPPPPQASHGRRGSSLPVIRRVAKLSDPWLALARLPAECAGGPWSPEVAAATGAAAGSDVAHLAPELLLSGRLHPSSDVFSLGMLMYRMLSPTGEAPYAKMKPAEVAYKVAACGMRPAFSPAVPEPLRRLVEDMWASDPAVRPTVPQLLARLSDLAAAAPALQRQWRERHAIFGAVATVPITAVAVVQLRGEANDIAHRWAEAAGIRLPRTSLSVSSRGGGGGYAAAGLAADGSMGSSGFTRTSRGGGGGCGGSWAMYQSGSVAYRSGATAHGFNDGAASGVTGQHTGNMSIHESGGHAHTTGGMSNLINGGGGGGGASAVGGFGGFGDASNHGNSSHALVGSSRTHNAVVAAAPYHHAQFAAANRSNSMHSGTGGGGGGGYHGHMAVTQYGRKDSHVLDPF